jgi:hypothetical protein
VRAGGEKRVVLAMGWEFNHIPHRSPRPLLGWAPNSTLLFQMAKKGCRHLVCSSGDRSPLCFMGALGSGWRWRRGLEQPSTSVWPALKHPA